jgi:MFS family permease
MRRLVLLVGAVVFADTMLFAALVPLLAGYAEEHGLSKTAAGALLAAYPAGALAGALPGGLAATRFGPKRAVVGGLALMSVAGLAFGLADAPWALGLARFLQGFGSALSWSGALAWLISATPRGRRGEMLGTAMGAAVFGALLGPALGGAAGIVGEAVSFGAVSLGGVALIVWTLRTPGVAADRQPLRAAWRALREPAFLGGLWLLLLPALLFGVLDVLVPLELGANGWGTAAIAAVFFAAAASEVVLNPVVGRVADRRGRLFPVRLALAGSVAVSLGLAWADDPLALVPLTIAASLAYGTLLTPGTTVISDSAERTGVAQGLAFGLLNGAWAVGAVIGPGAGGALADRAGDAVAFALLAGVCAATLTATRLRPMLGTRPARVPEST